MNLLPKPLAISAPLSFYLNRDQITHAALAALRLLLLLFATKIIKGLYHRRPTSFPKGALIQFEQMLVEDPTAS